MVAGECLRIRYLGTIKLVYTGIMLGKVLTIIGIISVTLLAYVLLTTTPSQVGVVGVLVVFLSFYIALAVLMTFFIYWFNKLVTQLFFADVANYKNKTLSLKKSYYYGLVLALGPVVLISLQSVGGGSVRSFIMVCVLLILGSIYIAKQTS